MITAIIPKLPFINKNETIDFYSTIGFQLDSDYGGYLIFSWEQTELHFFSHAILINLAIIFSKYFVYLSYGKNRFSYVVRTRAIRFS